MAGDDRLVMLEAAGTTVRTARHPRRVLLIRPPFFTPMSPPLGLGMLKSFVEQHGHQAACVDLNVDQVCWALLQRYFDALEQGDTAASSNGYSTFWPILNAHAHAALGG